jgi:hypothetical protein
MATTYLLLTLDEAAAAAALEAAVVRRCAEIGLVAPEAGYGAAELAELRRVRRLIDELELSLPGVEVVLRMRQRLLALQAEVQRLEAELRRANRPRARRSFDEAEWDELI